MRVFFKTHGSSRVGSGRVRNFEGGSGDFQTSRVGPGNPASIRSVKVPGDASRACSIYFQQGGKMCLAQAGKQCSLLGVLAVGLRAMGLELISVSRAHKSYFD